MLVQRGGYRIAQVYGCGYCVAEIVVVNCCREFVAEIVFAQRVAYRGAEIVTAECFADCVAVVVRGLALKQLIGVAECCRLFAFQRCEHMAEIDLRG